MRQQQRLAVAEVTAGDLRVQAARESAAIAAQELAISSLQASHAREILDFLTAKRFATADLFDWVSDVLQDVYRFFLHQATAMARQAEAQLAFERQELLPWFIRHDYWTPLPAANGAAGGDAFVTAAVVAAATSGVPADRRGLTGSARLLHDVYALDDLAFRTDSRKLQLTRVISLARLDPVAFQDLRETGMLRFATPMSLFDHDFPGHYLRLIRRVRTSVVALIPPSEGIRATLTSSGVSRVVIGNPTFDAVDLRRDPESVALSAPVNATGVFELDAQARLLAPFEGIGVDTRWELELPRAANPFDFSTIADILFTIDYTALHSNELRSRRLKEREPTTSVDRAFSFRNELADQWYDLYHPELLDTPFSVTFRTNRSDFPPNLEEPLTIAHAALYFSRLPLGPALTPFEATLQFRPDDGTGTFGGAAQVGVDGLVSTRQGNTAGWLAPASLLGGSPIGEWTLSLPDNPGVRQIFADTPPLLEDILFILTVAGTTPTWAN